MKNLLFTLCLVLGLSFSLTGQTDYKQYETHRFMAKRGHEADFEKGLGDHNKKYHNAAPYKTSIFEIITGPDSRAYELSMGPMTFTQMEGRPSSADHDADWAKVMEHADPVGETQFWREDKEIVYMPEGADKFTAYRWRYFTIKPGQGDRFESMVNKFMTVLSTKKYPASYKLYWKFGASEGPHACVELGMSSWAYFDRPNTLEADFEEVHGKGSYQDFSDDMENFVDRSRTYDEMVKFNPALSSDY